MLSIVLRLSETPLDNVLQAFSEVGTHMLKKDCASPPAKKPFYFCEPSLQADVMEDAETVHKVEGLIGKASV